MSIEKLLELSRLEYTPEQKEDINKRIKELNERMNKKFLDRFRCGTCGADTYNYSHTFDCPRRGSGF